MVRDVETALADMQGLGIVLDPVTEEAFRAEYDRLTVDEPAEVRLVLKATDNISPALERSQNRRTAAQKAAPVRKGTSATARKGATK
jgi:hypothetical protein